MCPRCGALYTKYLKNLAWEEGDPPFAALSRRDNKTYICSACGEIEAFEAAGMVKKYSGRKYWK